MAYDSETSIRSGAGPRPNNGPSITARSSQAPALRGATLAFNAQAIKSPVADHPSQTNGARKAALIADNSHNSVSQDTWDAHSNSTQRDVSPQRLITVTERIKQLNSQGQPVAVQTTFSGEPPTSQTNLTNSPRIAAQLAVGKTVGRNKQRQLDNLSQRGESNAQAGAPKPPVKSTGRQLHDSRTIPVESVRSPSSGRSIQSTLDNEEIPPLPPRFSDGQHNRQSSVERLHIYGSDSPPTPTGSRVAGLRRTTQQTQFLSPRPSRSTLQPQHSGMSESFLADAITASSIAASRSPSPSRSNPPPPPPQRGTRSRLNTHSSHKKSSRTPSPSKGMKQTMRANDTGHDDESERLSKHHRLAMSTYHKKLYEGNRKRWRDGVTERARKRYEGVWAANKGLLIEPNQYPNMARSTLQGMVLNIVVRDIWSRSRLNPSILEQIWDLVSERGDGILTREEFVVGMWLIDQSLKGRKVPAKVSESMWASVQQVHAVQPHG